MHESLHVSYGERIETRYLSKDGYFYGIPFLGDLTGKGMGEGFFFGEFAKKDAIKEFFLQILAAQLGSRMEE